MAVENVSNIEGLVGATNQTETVEHKGWDILHLFDSTSMGNFELYSGGFVGIDLNNITQIETDIKDLIINPVNEILTGFGGDENTFNQGLKGHAQQAAIDYVAEIKHLLEAYTSSYNEFINLAAAAAQGLATNDNANRDVISQAQQDIKEMATNLEVEAQEISVDW